jgi:GNAT superfamily N-acetyltransferase
MPLDQVTIRRLGRPGDLGWVIQAHGEVYADEFGWDLDFEALVATIVSDFATAPPSDRQAAWIAERGCDRVGCVFCVPVDERVAQLRILLVDPSARGIGLGARLVDECVTFAGTQGYELVRLWTNHPLAAARHLYLAKGFTLVSEDPHHSFGADLVGQVYELALA